MRLQGGQLETSSHGTLIAQLEGEKWPRYYYCNEVYMNSSDWCSWHPWWSRCLNPNLVFVDRFG